MSSNPSAAVDDECFPPIRLINWEHLKEKPMFPRFPEDKDLTVLLDQVDVENSFIIFISHCWLRGWSGAEGWDGRPHPDNASHGKWFLCKEAITKTIKTQAPGMKSTYVWIDYGCINQDGNPAGELKQLDAIMKVSDVMLTPIWDPQHRQWNKPASIGNWLLDYKAQGFQHDVQGYVNRAWCRMEMYFAAHVPLSDVQILKCENDLFAAGTKTAISLRRRPHILYGSKESENGDSLIFLPAMQDTYLSETSPMQGHLTNEDDRQRIKDLMDSFAYHVKTSQVGYVGSRNEQGLKHGYGKEVFPNGRIYEGDYVNDKMQGQGTYVFANGDKYEGGWFDNLRHGEGVMFFANGDVYKGAFVNGIREGHATWRYADSGNVYEGEIKQSKRDGQGTMTYGNGDVYTGGWKKDVKHGKGSYFVSRTGQRFDDYDWIDDVCIDESVQAYIKPEER